MTYTEALEAVYADRLNRKQGYVEIPISLFIDKVDVNMPSIPEIAFYQFKGEKAEVIKPATQAYSPLALSLHETIWIKAEDLELLRRFVESVILKPSDSAGAFPSEKRMEILRRSAIMIMDDLFIEPSPENINKSVKVVRSFVYVMMKEPKAYLLLIKLSSHDPYTLQHSVGTAVNAIILAKKLGITAENELLDIGMAGLLHDIGKVRIKKEIINKAGPLNEQEWEEMRQHSKEGYEIVKDNPNLSERTKKAILEHHEDKVGTGYPNGLKLEQLDVFSKIVSICDIFNALTTDRTYAKARTAFEAFQFMRDKLGHKIDDDIFKQLVLVYGGKID